MKYAVIFRRTATGWSCDAPDLPGCIATGATLDETRLMMAEAMGMHINGMREDGDPVPDPETHVEHVEVLLPVHA